jgi:hypothetical protein
MRNKHATQLIFELSTTGRNGVVLPECDVPTHFLRLLNRRLFAILQIYRHLT